VVICYYTTKLYLAMSHKRVRDIDLSGQDERASKFRMTDAIASSAVVAGMTEQAPSTWLYDLVNKR